MLDKLEQWFGRYAVPNLTLGIIAAQVLVYLAYLRPDEMGDIGDRNVIHALELVPNKVLQGEVWRILTFVAVPPFGTSFLPVSQIGRAHV